MFAPSAENLLMGSDGSHQRVDSLDYHKASMGSMFGTNGMGENQLLDTAETLKQTLDHEPTLDYDGLHAIESVSGFPHEAVNEGFHQSTERPVYLHSALTTSSIDHLQSALNEQAKSRQYTSGKDFVASN